MDTPATTATPTTTTQQLVDQIVKEVIDKAITQIGLPTRLKHIKNPRFLKFTLDPINNKYVKKIWAHKLTKLEREKRDMIWEYYRYRNRMPVCDALKKTYMLNVKEITIIYFDDPVQHRFVITEEMFQKIKMECRDREADRKLETIERKKKKEADKIKREEIKLKKLAARGLTLEDAARIKAERKAAKKLAQQQKKEERLKKKALEPKKKFFPKNKDKYDPVLRKKMKEKKKEEMLQYKKNNY